MKREHLPSESALSLLGLDIVISDDWAPKVGGAHHWLLNVYSRWPGRVQAFVATPTGEIPDGHETDVARAALQVHRDAVPVANVSLNPLSWLPVLRNARAVRRLMAARRLPGPLRVHCKANFPEGLTGLLATAGTANAKLFVYAHGEEILVAHSSRLLRWIARKVYARADLVIVNSLNTERLVRQLEPTARTEVVHPGVDAGAFAIQIGRRASLRRRYGWEEGECVLVTIARLEPRKNVASVVTAVGRLRAAGLSVRYVCVGRGEERAAIAAQVAELGLGDCVELRDFVSEAEKVELLSAADIHVLPSIQHGPMIEGFGIVFVEAAAAGIPSVSGLSGGQCEAVHHDRTGLNVDGDSIDELTGALDRLARDSGLRERLGRAGRKWASSLDWGLVVDRIRSATTGSLVKGRAVDLAGSRKEAVSARI